MGAGSLRQAGEEGAGSGISKGGGSREKWEKLEKWEKNTEAGAVGGGNRACKVREAGSSDPPVAPPPSNPRGVDTFKT